MKAIRWIGAGTCEFCDQDSTPSDPTPLQSAMWERNPTRQVSAEVAPKLSMTFGKGIGLLVDKTSKLIRVYAIDAWTQIMEDGYTIRSMGEDFDPEDECYREFGTEWEDCHRLYHSIEDRDEWCEAILDQPQYTHIVLKDTYDEELLRAVQSVFDLPIITDLES